MNPTSSASLRPIVSTLPETPRTIIQSFMEYIHSRMAIFFLRLISGGGFFTLAIAFLLTYENGTITKFDPKLNQAPDNSLYASIIFFIGTYLFWWGPEGTWWILKKTVCRPCVSRWNRWQPSEIPDSGIV